MASKMLEKLRRRIIKVFMDILILKELKNGQLSGYDVIGLIHKRFGIWVSSGTVYSLMYSIERDGLVEGVQNRRKRVYTLTEKGERKMKVITKANEEIQNFLRSVSLLHANSRARAW